MKENHPDFLIHSWYQEAIVKLLGGKIWLDVKYAAGSRFIFELPKKQG